MAHVLEILITFNQYQHVIEVSAAKCLEISHSCMRKWKMTQSLSCLTENVIVNFNSVAQTMMLDKIVIYKGQNDSAKYIASKIIQNVH